MDLKLLMALVGLLTLGGCGGSESAEADAGIDLAPACDPGEPPCDTPKTEASEGLISTYCQAEGWGEWEDPDGVVISWTTPEAGFNCWPGARVAMRAPSDSDRVCWDRDGQLADCATVLPEVQAEIAALKGDAGAP